MKSFILILTGALVFQFLNAQMKTVEGRITTYNEIPVLNAQILVKSSKQKFTSDSLGLFSVQCSLKDKLSVSAEGFVTTRVKIGEQTKFALVNLNLKSAPGAKEVAVGYGHVKDRDKLYAMSGRDSDEFNYSSYRNIYEALVGLFPGVQIINGEVIIRGSVSFETSASALIIVDGREVSGDSFGNILPSDIARITILKDASTAVYGVKGGNGVVIVETKRGEEPGK